MEFELEITSGATAGKVIPVREGKPVTVGRDASMANVVISGDSRISRAHFQVQWDGSVARLADRKSTNHTFVNNNLISETTLRDGDRIRAGDTLFVARIKDSSPTGGASGNSVTGPARTVPDPVWDDPGESTKTPTGSVNLQPVAALVVGSWSFGQIPAGWTVDEGYGMHLKTAGSSETQVVASQETLSGGVTLQNYIDAEIAQVEELVLDPDVEPRTPARIPGADEAFSVTVRYKSAAGKRFVQQQIYARKGNTAGILTLTTPEAEWSKVKVVFQSILSAAAFGH